jgi:hypothetical protein
VWPAATYVPWGGIQKVAATSGNLLISWDVALDINHVGCALYYQTSPFDFASNPKLTGAIRVVLTPTIEVSYAQAWSYPDPDAALLNLYPYQQSFTGLASCDYYLLIRAFDSFGKQDANQVVLSVAL